MSGHPTSTRRFRSPRSALCIGICLMLSSAACNRQERANAEPAVRADKTWPNVLLISVDMLRPDHLGSYGYDRATSPNIDRLARDGALFENAVSSAPWTLPAHAALMTGLVDSVHGCLDTNRRLVEDRTTLAERLKSVGYATVGFFSGPYLHPVFGLSQGFDRYIDCTSYPQLNRKTLRRTGTVEGPAIWDASARDVTSPRVTKAVRDWFEENPQAKPFFMFVHLWDVHYDFIPPKPYALKFDPNYDGSISGEHFLFNQWINARMPQRDLDHLIALYDAEIAWTDLHIGMILDALETRGLLDSTVIALVADHGTEFFEHGEKGHRKSLFDEAIHIPFIMRFPRRIPAERRLATQVRIIDVAPTIMELVGLQPPRDIMGQSLAGLFSGGRLARDNLAVSELYSAGRRMRSFRRRDHKVIVDQLTGRTWVYDLAHDPAERTPIADGNASLVKTAMRDVALGEQWLATFGGAASVAQGTSRMPPEVLEKLRTLGYVGGE